MAAPCPICGKPAPSIASLLGPFCSQRCKLIDLGIWFGEEYRISDELQPEHFEEYEALSGGVELDRPRETEEG